ncbi:exported hypothetical protein [Vibrio chagasii]|nr:exported hypothetical protein [Vibrio chagasii]CAH6885743.1 exported hypothetical protein [Vibrio chagasii]CAH6977253.1 exported hypothetical protein [Vibrio chagasii]CAH7123180.1 exported hypothetical protein [Vibrio chagasii]CAH7409871.1 exported hypothetical protein [Vibrio chagasii]
MKSPKLSLSSSLILAAVSSAIVSTMMIQAASCVKPLRMGRSVDCASTTTTASLRAWPTTKTTVSIHETKKQIFNRVFVNKYVQLLTIGANLSNISRPKASSTD